MDNSCGLGQYFRPQWLNRFATTRWFLVVYGLLGTTQAMAYIYFVATLTTMEKRFKIPSKTTGIVMSGNEISQILLSLSLTYYGGRGNRPRWIAWGVAISGLSCFILSVPHLVYGPGRDALALTVEHLDTAIYNKSSSNPAGGSSTLCSAHNASGSCAHGESGEYSMMPLVLIFLSQFVLGVGTTLYYALGQTYLDDNTKKTRTPLLLSFVLALRTIGPALGFVLGYACLSLYIDPSLTPVIGKKDPRWLGAWWLGWIFLGTIMMVLALLIGMFPVRLPTKKKRDTHHLELDPVPNQPINKLLPSPEEPLLTKKPDSTHDSPAIVKPDEDFVTSLCGLLKNKLLMCNNVAAVFYILGASGYITFATKYMETQYQQSAAGANIIAGVSGILAMVAGFLISGIVITKCQPRPRYLLGWNVVIGVCYIAAEISFIFLGCPDNGLRGLHNTTDGLQLTSACNSGCGCTNIKYSPVCSVNTAETFYSACHAGCQESLITNSSNKKFYGNCSCITEENFVPYVLQFEPTVSDGPCRLDCGRAFFWFLLITCAMHVLGSSGKIGNILVNYRCVDEKDKAFAQGLTLLLISLFAFIPGPILYGAIIDSACLVWDNSCGRQGHCWLYHKENFRFYLNSTAAVLTTVGVVLDVVVWVLGQNLDLYSEKATELTENPARKQRNPISTLHQ